MSGEVKEIVEKSLKIEDISDIPMEESLRDYGLNSLSAIEIIISIEELLGVEIGEEDLLVEKVDNLLKIQQLYDKYKK